MSSELPRGVRNNNPGNIRHDGKTVWDGQAPAQADPDFVVFTSPEYGIRAIAVILHSYKLEGISTIAGAIARWAPQKENNTGAYCEDVCRRCSVGSDVRVDLDSMWEKLVPAIIAHECDDYCYPDAVLQKGLALARPVAKPEVKK